MPIVATADWHLWPSLWPRVFPHAVNDTMRAARFIMDHAREVKAPVLCAGDVFHHGHSGGVAAGLCRLSAWLSEAAEDVGFYYVVGNHERTGHVVGRKNPDWLEAVNGATHIPKDGRAVVYSAGSEIAVAGLDYSGDRDDLAAALAAFKENPPDILVLHQAAKELLGYEGAFDP